MDRDAAFVPPSIRHAALEALQTLEDALKRQVAFHVEEVAWKKTYEGDSNIEVVVPYICGTKRSWYGRKPDPWLNLGLSYTEHAQEGRQGYVIVVGKLHEPLDRFGLYDRTPVTRNGICATEVYVNELTSKLTREPVGRQGKTRQI